MFTCMLIQKRYDLSETGLGMYEAANLFVYVLT